MTFNPNTYDDAPASGVVYLRPRARMQPATQEGNFVFTSIRYRRHRRMERAIERASDFTPAYIATESERPNTDIILSPAPLRSIVPEGPMPNAEFFSKRFGLRERPFTLLPDPDFLFWSPAHTRAFAVLEYGVIARAPITVITGEVGAGKTTLLQYLLRHFDDDVLVGLISNAQGGRGDLLAWAMGALDVDAPAGGDYVANHQALQNFLIEQYSEGRRVVLIIDEAQNISVEGLEELRMLTNINSGKDELLQLILVGQPELRDMVTRPELRQFAQRVSASFHLPAMDLETTKAYVRHRLIHAGGTGQEFNDGAIALIHQRSRGVPRLVNKFADFAMVYASSSDHPLIDELTVTEIFRDRLFLDTIEPPLRDAAE